jgi:hypothetical protein
MTRATTGRLRVPRSVTGTLLAAVAGVALLTSAPPAAAEQVPYTDERSTGALTLCDSTGHELRAGALTARPLAARVVGGTAAPTTYAGGRATATLYGYQPRQGLDPAQWSGELLTGASRFADPHHPAVAVLPEDTTLGQYVADFPPSWDGLVQLRVYLGAPGAPLLSQRYDSADLRVTGGSWALVRGGGGSCAGARAVAVATLLGVQASSVPSTPATPARGAAVRPPSSSGGSSTGSGSSAESSSAAVPASSSSGLSGLLLPLGGGLLVFLLVSGAGVLRRRRKAPTTA